MAPISGSSFIASRSFISASVFSYDSSTSTTGVSSAYSRDRATNFSPPKFPAAIRAAISSCRAFTGASLRCRDMGSLGRFFFGEGRGLFLDEADDMNDDRLIAVLQPVGGFAAQ